MRIDPVKITETYGISIPNIVDVGSVGTTSTSYITRNDLAANDWWSAWNGVNSTTNDASTSFRWTYDPWQYQWTGPITISDDRKDPESEPAKEHEDCEMEIPYELVSYLETLTEEESNED